MRLLLLNPNTNAATTAAMCAVAQEAAGPAARVSGMTATEGASVIADPAALAVAAGQVGAMAGRAEPCDAAVVAAFGDPGLAAARAALPVPVCGLAEAAIAAARAGGRRFAIVTTTPALDGPLRQLVRDYDAAGAFAGLHYTRSGPAGMAEPDRLAAELLQACRDAEAAGAGAVIIGGGPLADAARGLRGRVEAALIEPIPAAVEWLVRARRPPG